MFISGIVFAAAAVLMQEVRSRLVTLLIAAKSPMSMELSDWGVSGGRIPGNYDAIKKQFIWGPQSRELLKDPSTAPMVKVAKVLYVIREVGRVCGLASLALFLWSGFVGFQ